MVAPGVRLCAVCELAVIFFQVFGVAALCLTRLSRANRWVERGRLGFVIALVGLGMAGAMCGRNDSSFALFAGVSMTLLLIGMNMGSGPAGATDVHGLTGARPRNLAGSLTA
jgi:hypothetical protein